MSAVREWAASQNNKVLKLAFLSLQLPVHFNSSTLGIDLFHLMAGCSSKQSSEIENGNKNDCAYNSPCHQRLQSDRAGVLVASGVVLLYISAGLAIWSLDMRNILRVLLK